MCELNPSDRNIFDIKIHHLFRYAGPGSQKITDALAIGFETFISNRTDVIHISIDGRGTLAKGSKMMFAVYRNLGSAEMEDQITVTKFVLHL